MNKVFLIGRITADPELRYTTSNKAYSRLTLAVNRNYKNEDGDTPADFISIVAWDKIAEVIEKYLKKGSKIAVSGKIQTGSYDKEDGSRGYLTDVIVSDLEFLDNKPKDSKPAPEYAESTTENDPFADFGDSVELTDNDLPF